jgi:hypothetical protein
MTISKKAAEAKAAALANALETDNTNAAQPKNRARAFVNWSVPKADGSGYIHGDRGFPIFQNPEYPSPREDLLIALAEKHGGSVELTMKVRVTLADYKGRELSVDDILVAAA